MAKFARPYHAASVGVRVESFALGTRPHPGDPRAQGLTKILSFSLSFRRESRKPLDSSHFIPIDTSKIFVSQL